MNVSKLTVLFDDPFWIGVLERESDGVYEVCKVTFGAEPKDYEVNEFLKRDWAKLRFSPALKADAEPEKWINPKRRQRDVHKLVTEAGIGTKAQQALKLLQEQGKQERKARSRSMRETQNERRYELRQEKRKEKHRGH